MEIECKNCRVFKGVLCPKFSKKTLKKGLPCFIPKYMIKIAQKIDIEKIYNLGLKIPEIKVNYDLFMSKEELESAISNPAGIFLIAEIDGKIIGFTYAKIRNKSATGVYLVVDKWHRRKGIATALWYYRREILKERGVKYIHSWVGIDNEAMKSFMKNRGMSAGNDFRWYSMKIKSEGC